MRAIFEYTDHLVSRDGKQVHKILAEHNIEVIKTTTGFWTRDKRVTIRVQDYDELNLLLSEFYNHCRFEVHLIKVQGDGIFSRLRRKPQ